MAYGKHWSIICTPVDNLHTVVTSPDSHFCFTGSGGTSTCDMIIKSDLSSGKVVEWTQEECCDPIEQLAVAKNSAFLVSCDHASLKV